MLLLFIHVLITHLLGKLASLGRLRTPCLICSRENIDRNGKHGFYKNFICSWHKMEISSLTYCAVHKKIADVHDICEKCHNSTSYNGDSQGIYGDPMLEAHLLAKGRNASSWSTRICSCCSKPCSIKTYVNGLFESKINSPDVVYLDGCTRETEEKREDGNDDLDHQASHIGYSEPKISSDSEPEVLWLDEDDGYAHIVNCKEVLRQELLDVEEKLINFDDESTIPRDSDPKKQVLEGVLWDLLSLPTTCTPELGLENADVSQIKAEVGSRRHLQMIPEQTPEILVEDIRIEDVKSTPSTPKGDATNITGYLDKNLSIRTLNDVYRHSIAKAPMQSPTVAELVRGRDNARFHEDLKEKLSQIPTTHGLEFPWGDITPRRPPLEPFDGSGMNEVEGESELDRLKRRVEFDKKSMNILYKELEEERNASAIAVNQAMAMINRLQEEKAAMQMEALQYLRMMEEQAEYDQEALERSNDLLVEREKEIQDLEAELESCKKQLREQFSVSDTTSVATKDPLFDIKEDKAYISNCLKKLNDELRSPNEENCSDRQMINSEENGIDDLANSCSDGSKEKYNPSTIYSNGDYNANYRGDSGGGQSNSLKDEVLELHKRLKELEADQDFM